MEHPSVLLFDETLTVINVPTTNRIATMVGTGKQGSSKNEEERKSIMGNFLEELAIFVRFNSSNL